MILKIVENNNNKIIDMGKNKLLNLLKFKKIDPKKGL